MDTREEVKKPTRASRLPILKVARNRVHHRRSHTSTESNLQVVDGDDTQHPSEVQEATPKHVEVSVSRQVPQAKGQSVVHYEGAEPETKT